MSGRGDVKWQFDLENWTLSAVHQHLRQNNVPRTHRTQSALPFEGSSIGSDIERELDQERSLSYLRLAGYRLDNPLIDRATLTLSHQYTREERDRLRASGHREYQGMSVNTLGLTAQVGKLTQLGDLTLGLEVYEDRVDSFSSRNPIQGPVGDDATYSTVDVYLHDHVTLGRFNLTAGLRHTLPRADADRVQDPDTGAVIGISEDWSATTGSFGVSYELGAGQALYAGVNQGFRAPNLSDLTRFDSARSDEFEIPAPNLDPERFTAYEIGYKAEFGRGRVQAAYFYTDVKDLIQRFTTGRVRDGEMEVTKRNVADGHAQGVEIEFGYVINERWNLNGYATWLDTGLSYPELPAGLSEEPFTRTMPVTYGLTLRYDASERWWAETQIIRAHMADELSLRDQADTTRIPPGGTPGYTVAHLRSGFALREGVMLHAGVDNLFDRNYRIHGSGSSMPGRNFLLGVEVSW